MSESSSDLTVLSPITGEWIDLRAADTETLARIVHEFADRRADIAAFEEVLERELLARMDYEAMTMLRAGNYELKAPSPSAGTESYDPVALEEWLGGLLEHERISAMAASAALKRLLTLKLEVSWDTTPDHLADEVERATAIHIAGFEVKVLSASGSLVPVLAGISRLRKLGLGEDLDAALVSAPAPRRRVKVTRRGRS